MVMPLFQGSQALNLIVLGRSGETLINKCLLIIIERSALIMQMYLICIIVKKWEFLLFSYSAVSPVSGVTHDATAFVGCDNNKVGRFLLFN